MTPTYRHQSSRARCWLTPSQRLLFTSFHNTRAVPSLPKMVVAGKPLLYQVDRFFDRVRLVKNTQNKNLMPLLTSPRTKDQKASRLRVNSQTQVTQPHREKKFPSSLKALGSNKQVLSARTLQQVFLKSLLFQPCG